MLQCWHTHLGFKYAANSFNKSFMFQCKGGQVDTHVSYFMTKTLTEWEWSNCVCERAPLLVNSLVLCIPKGIQWFIIALPLHISSFGSSRSSHSPFPSLQQDGDEVGLGDGAGGAADVLRERRRGPREDLREPEAGEVHSFALTDEGGVAEHQLHHRGPAPHPDRSVRAHHPAPLWGRPAAWVLTEKGTIRHVVWEADKKVEPSVSINTVIICLWHPDVMEHRVSMSHTYLH